MPIELSLPFGLHLGKKDTQSKSERKQTEKLQKKLDRIRGVNDVDGKRRAQYVANHLPLTKLSDIDQKVIAEQVSLDSTSKNIQNETSLSQEEKTRLLKAAVNHSDQISKDLASIVMPNEPPEKIDQYISLAWEAAQMINELYKLGKVTEIDFQRSLPRPLHQMILLRNGE